MGRKGLPSLAVVLLVALPSQLPAKSISSRSSSVEVHPYTGQAKADKVFVDGLKSMADSAVIDIWEIEAHINDKAFSRAVVEAFEMQVTEVQGRTT